MRAREWTAEEKSLLRDLYPIHLGKDIATLLKRSQAAVFCRASLLGIKKQPVGFRPTRSKYNLLLKEELSKIGLSYEQRDGREWRIARCRYRVWKKLRDSGASLTGIAMVANKDHTTVINGLSRINSVKQ